MIMCRLYTRLCSNLFLDFETGSYLKGTLCSFGEEIQTLNFNNDSFLYLNKQPVLRQTLCCLFLVEFGFLVE